MGGHARGSARHAAGTWRAALAIAACVVIAGGSVRSAQKTAPPPDEASFDALYKRGSQINANLKTLTARFTETTTSSLLTRDLVSSGTVAVERPSRVILRYEQPEPRVVLIDGDRLTLLWPARNLRQVTNIASAQRRVQRYFVDSTPGELREQFEIDSRTANDRNGAFKLTMSPKRRQIREGLTRLELWLNASTLLLDAMRMTFPNGDAKLMTFEDVKTNVALEAQTFTIPR